MKFAFALILLVFLGTSIEGTEEDYSAEDIDDFRSFVASSVFEIVANKLRNFHGPFQQDPSAKATIVPPIKDPLTAGPLNICGLNVTIPLLNISIQGDVNVMDPVVTGLSKFQNNLTIQLSNNTFPPTLTIDLDIALPQVSLVGPYMAEIVFSDEGAGSGSLDLTGNGVLPCGASDVFLKFHGKGKVPLIIPGFTLDELDVDLGFQNLMFDPSGLTSEGVDANLTSLARNVQRLFDSLWTEPTKIAVNEIIRCLIDDLFSECTLLAIGYGGGNLNCLKDTINMECFPSEVSSFEEQYIFQTPVCESLLITTTEGSEEPVTPPNAAILLAISPIVMTVLSVLSVGNIFV